MEEKTPIELRSEKTQHFIGTVPGLLVRSGIALVLGVLLLTLGIAWLIEIPQERNGEILKKTGQEMVVVSTGTPLSGTVLCTLEENGSVLWSDSVRILRATRPYGTDTLFYRIAGSLPDTLKNGTEQIVLRQGTPLPVRLSAPPEKLLFQLIPLFDNHSRKSAKQ